MHVFTVNVIEGRFIVSCPDLSGASRRAILPFLRFKPRHQFFTLCYPAMYLDVQDKTIILPTGGGGKWGPKRYPNIVAHLMEEPPDHFHEVAVSRDALSPSLACL